MQKIDLVHLLSFQYCIFELIKCSIKPFIILSFIMFRFKNESMEYQPGTCSDGDLVCDTM